MKKNFLLGMALVLAGCSSPEQTVQVTPRAINAEAIVIQNVSVFDSKSGSVNPSMTVQIEGGRIISLLPAEQHVLEGDEYIISGEGRTLLPGLYDMHAHVAGATGPRWETPNPNPQANLLAFVYSGVTTVLDVGDFTDEAYSRRDQVASGELVGPRIFTAGRIITSPEGHPRAMIDELVPWWLAWYVKPKVATGIGTIDEAEEVVNKRAEAGADVIKIVVDRIPLEGQRMEAEIAQAVVDQAGKRSLQTVAHIGSAEDAIIAGQAGVALWVHGVYKEALTEEQIETIVGFGIPMVPTSEVFDSYGRAELGPIQATKLEAETVPQAKLDSFYPIPDDIQLGELRSWLELMAETIETRRDNVARLRAAGLIVFAGSDIQSSVFPGASLHRELVTLVSAGFTPAQAIQSATYLPAQFLAQNDEPDAGIIRVGKRADLILVEGDPTLDISALANIQEVVLNGVVMDRTPVANSL